MVLRFLEATQKIIGLQNTWKIEVAKAELLEQSSRINKFCLTEGWPEAQIGFSKHDDDKVRPAQPYAGFFAYDENPYEMQIPPKEKTRCVRKQVNEHNFNQNPH